MTVQFSIQKLVSDGTLSTVVLGIQYLQRNDIYMRIAGEETPQSGAPSGYTWFFIDNTTLKILPVVPNGVEVVIYRRTDINAMYNIYSQNAQFDEATIDENNQQLLYIAQEYLEQGLPGTGIESLEYVNTIAGVNYYRFKLTDGTYTVPFGVPDGTVVLRSELIAGTGSTLVGFRQVGAGSVPRTSQDKMRESLNVLDFGAILDGVTNNTSALSSTIAEAVISGRPVKIPKGTLITDGITSPPFNIIAEPGATLKLSTTSPTKTILQIIGVGDVSWDAITFDGGAEVGSIAYTIDSQGKCVLNDVNVKYFTDRCCVFSQDVTSTSIKGGDYSNCTGSDVLVVKSNNNNITGCNFSHITGHAVRFGRFSSDSAVDSGCNSSVVSCVFDTVLNDPVLCELGSKHVSIASNNYDKCRNICKVEQATEDCHSVTIVGNTLRRPSGSTGAFTRGVSATNSSRVTVIGNTIDLTGSEVGGVPLDADSGIVVGDDCTVSGNTIIGGAGIGVIIGGSSTCSANNIKDFTNIGIQAGGSSTVSGNVATSAANDVKAIRVGSPDTVITGNKAKLSGSNTVGFSGTSSAQRAIVVGNNFNGATTPISSAGAGSIIESNIP